MLSRQERRELARKKIGASGMQEWIENDLELREQFPWDIAERQLDMGFKVVVLQEGTEVPFRVKGTGGTGPLILDNEKDRDTVLDAFDGDGMERCNIGVVIPSSCVVISASENHVADRLLQLRLVSMPHKTMWLRSPRDIYIWQRIPENVDRRIIEEAVAHIDGAAVYSKPWIPVPGSQVRIGKRIVRWMPLSDERVGIADAPAQLLGAPPLYADFGAKRACGHTPCAPKPSVWHREDRQAVYYRGEINTIYGPTENAKTLAVCAAIAEVLSNGGTAGFIDLDNNGEDSIYSRLVQLGAPLDALNDLRRFRYAAPTDKDQLAQVLADFADQTAEVLGVDAATPLITMYDGNSQKDDDYTEIVQRTLQPITLAGTCVILVDHTTKAADADDPAGAASKLRKVGGVAIQTKLVRRFIEGEGGVLRLRGRKDRHSGLVSNCPRSNAGQLFEIGTFVLDPIDPATGVAAWRITRPSESPEIVAATDRDPHAVAAERLGTFTARELVTTVNGLPSDVKLTYHKSAQTRCRRWIDDQTAAGRIVPVPGSDPSRWKFVLQVDSEVDSEAWS